LNSTAISRPGRWYGDIQGIIVLTLLGLMAIGIAMVHSASGYLSIQESDNPLRLLEKHCFFVVASVIVLCAFSMVDYRWLMKEKVLWSLAIFTLGLLVVVLLFPPVNGARRWIRLGAVSFQPSELAKLTGILFFADFLVRRQDRIRTFAHGFLPSVAMAGGLSGLIVAERDLGTPVLLFCVLSAVMLAGGVRVIYMFVTGAAGASAVYLLIKLFKFRMDRIWAFLDPWQFPETSGYQVIQSMVAIHTGGTAGVGLGRGLQKHGFLPAHTSDFIFAMVGEELGLIGCAVLVLLFGVLLFCGLRVVQRAPDLAAALVAIGVVTSVGLQAIIHMGVVTCLFPTKGISLPFVSAGGSSMLLSAAGIGILLNIASQSRPQEAQDFQESVVVP
jgi:cell division protein FtsW